MADTKIITVINDTSPLDRKAKEWRLKSNLVMLYNHYANAADLELDYTKFSNMTKPQRKESNKQSIIIYGEDNYARYDKLKASLDKKDSDNTIDEYQPNTIVKVPDIDNATIAFESALDKDFIYDINRNEYRVYVQEDNSNYDLVDNMDIIKESVDSVLSSSNMDADTKVFPMFTPEEIKFYSTNFDGTPRFTAKQNLRLKNNVWLESYKNMINGNDKSYDSKAWESTIKQLYEAGDLQNLLLYGWNPFIRPTKVNIENASNRTKNFYKSKTDNIKFISLESFSINEDTNAIPNKCNLALIAVLNGSNIDSLGVTNNINNLNDVYKLIGNESVTSMHINSNDNIEVYVAYDESGTLFNNLIKNKESNIKSNSLNIKDYNKEALKRYLALNYSALSESPVWFDIYQGSYKDMNITGKLNFINKVLNKHNTIHTMIMDEAVTTNEFPIEFNKDGDLLISKGRKINYDGEYSRTHLALKLYAKNNNITGMKYCICKLWYLNILLEERIHDKKSTPAQIKSANKTRAKILNDINKYSDIVLKNDPDFDIIKTYDSSPFNNDKVRISSSTLDHTYNWIKKLVTPTKH